ncbi:MAG: SOS response-associated peptidase [Spirochaetota bacterium]
MVSMCGRFVGYSTFDQIRSHFKVETVFPETIHPSYNIAPQQKVAVVTQEGSERVLSFMHWGLVPSWAKDASIGNKMINARSETVAEKPAFKNAFRNRRCLIINDGFFEWQGTKGNKKPMFIKPKGEYGPFGFAGLWEIWNSKDDKSEEYRSCTIITTEASESIKPIHHRMPVVLKPSVYVKWLDPAFRDSVGLKDILAGHRYRDFESHPVSRDVNFVKNNDESLIVGI